MARLIGIVTVNYNTAECIDRLLGSLHENGWTANCSIVVVDNSTQRDELRTMVERAGLCESVTVLDAGANLGFAAANNLGLRHVFQRGATAAWLINPDAQVTSGTPTDLENFLSALSPSVGVVATRKAEGAGLAVPGFASLNLWTGRTRSSGNSLSPRRGYINFVVGNSMILTKAGWEATGGLCPDYFLYSEEADFALVLRQLHFTSAYVEKLTIQHDGGAATGGKRGGGLYSLLTLEEASRSSMILYRRHFLCRLPVALLSRIAYACVVFVRSPKGSAAVLRGIRRGLLDSLGVPAYAQRTAFSPSSS